MYLPESAKCPTISEKMGVILYLDNASEKIYLKAMKIKNNMQKENLNEEVKVFHNKKT